MTAKIKQHDRNQFALEGILNFYNVPDLYQQGIRLFKNAPALRIDLSQVKNSDSGGLALLLAWLRFAQQQAVELKYSILPAQMHALAEVAELLTILPIAVGE